MLLAAGHDERKRKAEEADRNRTVDATDISPQTGGPTLAAATAGDGQGDN